MGFGLLASMPAVSFEQYVMISNGGRSIRRSRFFAARAAREIRTSFVLAPEDFTSRSMREPTRARPRSGVRPLGTKKARDDGWPSPPTHERRIRRTAVGDVFTARYSARRGIARREATISRSRPRAFVAKISFRASAVPRGVAAKKCGASRRGAQRIQRRSCRRMGAGTRGIGSDHRLRPRGLGCGAFSGIHRDLRCDRRGGRSANGVSLVIRSRR